MNLFDIVGGAVLIVSALLGFSRGAVMEVVALVAFTVAAALAVWLLPYTGPFAHATVHPAWASNAVAVGISFLIAYFAIRILGDRLSRAMRSHVTLGRPASGAPGGGWAGSIWCSRPRRRTRRRRRSPTPGSIPWLAGPD